MKYYGFHTQWKEREHTTILLVVNDEESGTVMVEYSGDGHKTAYLWNLTVANNHRKHGVGKKLLDYAVTDAANRGCKEIYLEWNPLDSPGWVLDWYTRQGFKVSDNYSRGLNIRMVKKIKKGDE